MSAVSAVSTYLLFEGILIEILNPLGFRWDHQEMASPGNSFYFFFILNLFFFAVGPILDVDECIIYVRPLFTSSSSAVIH